jgi:myo-inositol-1(or 4)-monophosphatase
MPKNDEPPLLLDAAVRLAAVGGKIAADRIGQAKTTRKADRTFVTQVDFEIQDALLDILADQFSHHAVLVEEEVTRPERHAPIDRAGTCWVIDPLDGTRNFSRAFPVFATSVAVIRDGRPVVGAICHAMTGQIFSAAYGQGAFLDGQPTHVRDGPPTRDTMVFMRRKSGSAAPASMHHWLDAYTFRNSGSAALHQAFVAAGIADAAYHVQCKLWDLAAGYLLVSEAGGVMTTPDGGAIFPRSLVDYADDDMGFLAAGPDLHAHLLTGIRMA